MAPPLSRIAVHSNPDTACCALWATPDFRCARTDTGYVELLTDGHCRRGNCAKSSPSDAFEDTVALAHLLGSLENANSVELSEKLIHYFGSFSVLVRECATANPAPSLIPHNIFTLLSSFSRTSRFLFQQEAFSGEVVSSNDALTTYLYNEMAHLKRETFRVLFLNAQNRLLSDEVLWEGTVAKVQIHPREIIRRIIENNATAIILVHNHPSGDPNASEYDIQITNKLMIASAAIDVTIHDHLIISRNGYISMKREKLM